GYRLLPESIHKVHGSIDGVNNPGNTGLRRHIGAFFSDDSIIGTVFANASHYEFFGSSINFGYGSHSRSLSLAVRTDIPRRGYLRALCRALLPSQRGGRLLSY